MVRPCAPFIHSFIVDKWEPRNSKVRVFPKASNLAVITGPPPTRRNKAVDEWSTAFYPALSSKRVKSRATCLGRGR